MTNPTGTHPAADAWPMLADDELDQLAADIAANGLMHPIVLDADGRVLDGRNRLAACDRAGVEPTFTTFDGDPVAFVLSSNEHRRHLKTGQRAIAVARTIYTNLYNQEKAAELYGLKQPRIAEANTILEHAPDLADQVADGTTAISEALEEARRRKQASKQKADAVAQLRLEAADLAEQFDAGKLNLREAQAALIARKQEREETRRVAVQNFDTATAMFIGKYSPPSRDIIEQMTPARWAKAEHAHQYLTELLARKGN